MKDIEPVYNANALIDAFKKCSKGTIWKASVQKYEANLLTNTYHLQQELKTLTHKQAKPYEFPIHERGKKRHIKALTVRDRVVQRSVCDNLLMPAIRPSLIYDNGASMKGKGVDFTRRRLYAHLEKYYRTYGTNKGYILLIDYAKYFDNIQHDVLLGYLAKYFEGDALTLLTQLIKNFEIDVSYMTDEEYAVCMDTVFNSLQYEEIDKALLTGEKFMRKSMGIGSQISQIAGVFYPHRIDNYCKIVRGIKLYGRYADDSYAISQSKEYLIELLAEITEQAKAIGIAINTKKTRIVSLDSFEFLKLHYSLLPNGRVRVRTTNETFRRQRRRLLKLYRKMQAGKIPLKDIIDGYKSWRGSVAKYGNYYRIQKTDQYFKKIFNCEV